MKKTLRPLKKNKKITLKHSIKLLGVKIENQLNFDNHLTTRYKKAGSWLNVIGRLRKYIGFPEKRKALIKSFVFSNFNYCPLVYHLTSKMSRNKIESIQKTELFDCYMIIPAAIIVFLQKQINHQWK